MELGRVYSLCVLVVVMIVTTYTELQDNRIPNWLTLPALAIGFLFGYFHIGITLGSSLGGFLAGFGTLFIFYMFGGMGGGDVKLMGAVGALMGYPDILKILVYTAFLGGAMALVALIWKGQLLSGVGRALSMFFKTSPGPQLGDEEEAGDEGEESKEKVPVVTVPYGLAIVGGCLLHVFFMAQR